MRTMKHRVRRWTLAALAAAALGFGAAQAVASPAPADEARACNERGCDAWCRSQGGIDGRCTDTGQCLCLF